MGFLNQVREQWTESCASRKDLQGIQECFNQTMESICESEIPRYFAEQEDRIRKCYEACESCSDRNVSMMNLQEACGQFKEFSEAMRDYISEMCEKCTKESSFDMTKASTEAETLNANANRLVGGLFVDENQTCCESSCMEAVSCLESMMEFASQLDTIRECGNTVYETLCECANSEYANRLGAMYYATECGYAMNFLEKCEECFEKVCECVMASPASSKPLIEKVVF